MLLALALFGAAFLVVLLLALALFGAAFLVVLLLAVLFLVAVFLVAIKKIPPVNCKSYSRLNILTPIIFTFSGRKFLFNKKS
ncbi:hypothetical protein [Candidatus Rhabdochlamydia oedothoracis]|uniref:hypothetical protein n=1 Tax=Candidatus Rhabdochlamydia oedothoracis TaxID=2720720 RepID=UPI001C653028|nr:hypothetical protein [Candidatus Rhabdochlamydia oedothoracis]